jgi:hypothetical protein
VLGPARPAHRVAADSAEAVQDVAALAEVAVVPVICSRTGSPMRAWQRIATPASIRSLTTRVSTSSAAKCA